MGTNGRNASRYCGYRTPFYDEICSERMFVEALERQDFNLLPIGRQMKVFEREKLDLLALDKFARPWIFEFKRDLAPYESIAQLLAYGSYVSQWSREELEDKYKKCNRGRSLASAFEKRFTGSTFPSRLSNQVNLVLAAFEFSLPCRRGLAFLEDCSRLVIGRLKIDCLWDLQGPQPRPDYRFLRIPRPTRPFDFYYERRNPERYYMLSQDEEDMALTWSQCVSNRLLPIPSRWDIRADPIPPGSGVLVNLCNNPYDSDKEVESGLVGYGMTLADAFNLRTRMDEFELTPENVGRLAAFKGEIWVVPIRWLQVREADAPVKPKCEISKETGLREIPIENIDEALSHKDDLGVVSHDPFENGPEHPPDEDPGFDRDFFQDFQGIHGADGSL